MIPLQDFPYSLDRAGHGVRLLYRHKDGVERHGFRGARPPATDDDSLAAGVHGIGVGRIARSQDVDVFDGDVLPARD